MCNFKQRIREQNINIILVGILLLCNTVLGVTPIACKVNVFTIVWFIFMLISCGALLLCMWSMINIKHEFESMEKELIEENGE